MQVGGRTCIVGVEVDSLSVQGKNNATAVTSRIELIVSTSKVGMIGLCEKSNLITNASGKRNDYQCE